MISAVQYRKLMKVYRETDNLSESARKAGIDRKTARKCIHGGPPQGRRGPWTWRTREDPFEGVWKEIEGLLKQCPKSRRCACLPNCSDAIRSASRMVCCGPSKEDSSNGDSSTARHRNSTPAFHKMASQAIM